MSITASPPLCENAARLVEIEHFDVIIVGAGLSGIGAAAHLQNALPTKRYAILESRQSLGGTWDLFRYPGIRSDSDMYTLGYNFKPWTSPKTLADGPSIKAYLAETASERGIDRNIRFGHRVNLAVWDSSTARWTISAAHEGGETVQFTCAFLLMCAGYYSYADGHRPQFMDEDRFGGQIIHPQFWPEDLDYRGKRVVVIGSGATAVTLLPAMAETAAHVVMLQRTPTYVVSRSQIDPLADWARRTLPIKLAYGLVRWKNVISNQITYSASRKWPALIKRAILKKVRAQVGPGVNVEKHFTPPYNPWDQRICAVPDGDLFTAIRKGRASVVTANIDRFTERGVRLDTGNEVQADIVVTATGLKLNLLGDVSFVIDGCPTALSEAVNYRGCMYSGVPNMASMFGYTNASWTLKSDLASEFICRLMKKMDRDGTPIVTPIRDPSVGEEPFIDLTSGFFKRAESILPKQGSRPPWKLYQNYILDLMNFRFGKLRDGVLRFDSCLPVPEQPAPGRLTADERSAT